MDVVRGTFMIEGVKVFDGFRFLRCASVLVVDGQIAALEERLTPPADTPVIEGAGATVLPGLIDAHTHALPGALEAALRFGVTTELDMFADPHLIRSLKQQAAADSAGMAGLRSAGTGATAPGGHPTSLVDRGFLAPFPTITSPGQAETFVADRIAEGSDYLKVILEDGTTTGYPCPKLTSDTVHALIHAAHTQGRIAVVHTLTQADALLAVRAGTDGLAHLFLDQPPSVEFIDAAAQSGVFVIPTLTSLSARTGHRRGQKLQADPHLGPRLNDQQRFFLAMEFPVGPAAQADLDNAMETVSRLHQAGVTLLAGTDAFSPGTAHGVSLHDELALLVHAGLTPAAALATATSAPAAAFAVDRGRIASGLGADLVLIHGDPELDITSTRAIRKIWRNGQQTAR